MGENQVNHCFPLNGNFMNPTVFGVDGMAEAYNKSLAGVELSGPTYVAHVLREFVKHVKALSAT